MDKKQILFLLSHQPNPRFVKQICFLSKVHSVAVLYYYRDYMKDLSEEYSDQVSLNENIGSISNGNYLRRIGKYFKSIAKLRKIVKNKHYDTLIVNHIDTLALFKMATLFTKSETSIVMEISDLRAHTYTHSVTSKVMRLIERFIFRFVDKLIVTSPKFYDLYYQELFHGEHFVLENKPLSNMVPDKVAKKSNDRVVIGVVGLLLQGKPYKTLFETFKEHPGYEIHIHGKGTYQGLVEEYANKHENITYFGEYNFFRDSANIYASLDILYMPYDTTNGSLNNKIALPNKLYEAIYFGVPIITSKETYLGELVTQYGIGVALECCQQKNLLELTQKLKLEDFKTNFKTLSKDLYLADDDYQKLQLYLGEK